MVRPARPSTGPTGDDHARRGSLGPADRDDRARLPARRCPAWWPAPPGRTRTSGSCRRARRPGRSSRPTPRRRRRSSSRASRGLRAAARRTINGRSVHQAAEGLAGQARRGLAADAAQTREAEQLGWRPGGTSRRRSAGWPIRPAGRAAWPPRAGSRPARWRAWRRRQATSSAPHRVIVLFCDDLSGGLPAGELTGDDVIVVTSYLPTAAAASAAQADLLGAGAAQAAVVGRRSPPPSSPRWSRPT